MTARRLAVPALLALASLAAPSAAGAADVVADTGCVRAVPGTPTVTLTATGFTPGAVVTIRADDQVLATGAADQAGTLQQPVAAPTIANRNRTQQAFALTATDDRGVASPSRPLLVSRIGVRVPSRARPTSRVTYRAFGFQTGLPLYLHVRRGGRTLGTFSLGRTSGECGRVTRRLRYMPLRRYRTGIYEYWYSHARRYSTAQRIYGIRIQIVRRVVRR